jgi:hypothetical protein
MPRKVCFSVFSRKACLDRREINAGSGEAFPAPAPHEERRDHRARELASMLIMPGIDGFV